MLSGAAYGLMISCLIFCLGCGFYISTEFIINNTININFGRPYTVGDCVVILQVLLVSFFGFGNIFPLLETIMKGKGAAYRIYQIINRKPKIDGNDKKGIKPKKIEGHIEYRNVSFRYPSNPDVTILED